MRRGDDETASALRKQVTYPAEALLCDQFTGRTNPADDAYHVGLVPAFLLIHHVWRWMRPAGKTAQ